MVVVGGGYRCCLYFDDGTPMGWDRRCLCFSDETPRGGIVVVYISVMKRH